MIVHNVRMGFATNSSSTHSIIFLKPKSGARDKDVSHGEFGWDFFTAVSDASKRQYVAHHLYQALARQVTPAIAEAVVESWVKNYKSEPGGGAPLGHVDHQSLYVLPCSWDGKGVDKKFFDDFQEFFLQDKLAILGGNDNTDDVHPLANEGAFRLPTPRDGSQGTLVARKDPKNGYWTVFDRDNGSKVRFSFADPTSKREVTKATVPELIDVKITDHCPFGCNFCYQGSTHEGKHADHHKLETLAYVLGELRVFEVAIGGGEPTLHPKFLQILDTFKRAGVVANFTTKNLAWLRDPAVWPKVMNNIGAFAYSVGDEDDVRKLATLLTVNDIAPDRVNIQYVMGSTNSYTFEQILRSASQYHLRVTLLGYKMTGRGPDFKPHPYGDWVTAVTKLQKEGVYMNLGIDTALANESTAALAKAQVHPKLYETFEGRFSMYIDAVENKLGPSSYVPDIAMKRVTQLREEDILSAFATWGKTGWEKVDTLDV